jgi:methionyl-tRNA synthetase
MATQQIHHWLNAVWAVVAEANRYFAGEAPWHGEDRSAAPANRVVRDRRSGPPGRHSGAAGDARLLGKAARHPRHSADQRDFAGLGGAARIKPGTALPAPTGIFPRYIEPTAA